MAAGARHACRVRQNVPRNVTAVTKHGRPQCQRTGLVEHRTGDGGQSLQRIARFDEHAFLEKSSGRNNLHRGHGKAQCTGAGDDQDCNGTGDRLNQGGARDQPARQHRQCHRQNQRHIGPGRPVGQPHIMAAALLTSFQQPRQVRDEGILHPCRGKKYNGRSSHDCACVNRGARLQRLRRYFARHQRQVELAAVILQLAIHRHPVAASQQDAVTGHKVPRCHGLNP